MSQRGRCYLDTDRFTLTFEVIVPHLFDKDAAAKVVERCLLVALEHCPRKTEHIGSNLTGLAPESHEPWHLSDQLEFFFDAVQKLRLSFNDTMLVSYQADKSCKLKVAQGLHLLNQTIM